MNTILKLSIVFVLFGMISCNSSEEKSGAPSGKEQIKVTHPLGTTDVNVNPERVVVLDLGSLETLDQLDVKIVGTAKRNLPQHLNKYENDPAITDVGTLKEVNFEKVVGLNPDLIIISHRLQESYEGLSEIAPTIFLQVDYEDYLPSFEENVKTLGEIFDKEAEAENAIAAVHEKVKRAQEQTEKLPGKALVVLYNNGKFSAYGKGSRFGFIHDVLGIQQAKEDLEVSTHGFSISNEFIEQANPDYLFVIDRGAVVNGKGADKKEIENPLIQQTTAYRNNRIIYLDPEIWYLSGAGLTSVALMPDEVIQAINQ